MSTTSDSDSESELDPQTIPPLKCTKNYPYIDLVNKSIVTINFLVMISYVRGGVRCPISLPDIIGVPFRKIGKPLHQKLIRHIQKSGYRLITGLSSPRDDKREKHKTPPPLPKYFIIAWD